MIGISAILPAYNADATLGEALASIAVQSVAPREILVVDDGSSDDTASIASRSAGVRLLQQRNSGPGAALNLAAKEASGDWLACLDADDLWTQQALAAHFAVIQMSEADIAVGRVEEFRAAADDASVAPREPTTGWVSGATLFRRDLWLSLGGMPEHLRVGGWVDLMDRARRSGARIIQHDTIVLRRRIQGGTLSSSASRDADWLQIARRAIERRRNGG